MAKSYILASRYKFFAAGPNLINQAKPIFVIVKCWNQFAVPLNLEENICAQAVKKELSIDTILDPS